MHIPRNQTLAEALYVGIDNNEYLNEIYDSLLYNYSIKIFNSQKQHKEVNIKDALRFANLLTKSSIPEKRDRHRLWGQELVILLSIVYPENSSIMYYLGSILSTVGNYRVLKSAYVEGFQTADLFDGLYFEYDKFTLQIPGHEESYFFHDQKDVYEGLSSKYFSYSGPTSMGKSFVVQTFIKQQIENGSTSNYVILVPTKALINEIRSNIIGSLQGKLKETNYRVVSASGDIVLQQEHNFVFVMTPERLLHIGTKIEDNAERLRVLVNLMTKGYLEPVLFNSQKNELLVEADKLKEQKDSHHRSINGGVNKVAELHQLVKYVSKSDTILEFDEDLFEQFVNRVIAFSPTEIGFQLKCGITLKERMER